MEFHIKIAGFVMIVLGAVHAIFPKYFNWKTELMPLSLINRQIFYVHTFFIALTVFLIGILCVTSSQELMNTPLGKKVSLGIGLFWLCRLAIQFFGYSSDLWKGKRFETVVHIAFSITWAYFSLVFVIASLHLWN
jgi:hypothetical protein